MVAQLARRKILMGRLGLVCHQLMPCVLGTVLCFTGGQGPGRCCGNPWKHLLHPVQRGGRGCLGARQVGWGWDRSQRPVGLWWELVGPDVFVKVAVPTEDGWRVDAVVGQRGKGEAMP